MYRPAATATSNINFSNGHFNQPVNTFTDTQPATPDSESDLSEVIDIPNASTISSHPEAQELNANSESPKINMESSHEEDAIGSDDADYDMETPPVPNVSIVPDDSSSSEDSQRLVKRKAGTEQDDHMMNNPELYGLRRSVNQPCT